jgi:inner membrane transporter RhtA
MPGVGGGAPRLKGGLARPAGSGAGVAAMLTSVVIIQTGASFGKMLVTDAPGPMAAVWLRLGTASVVMLVFWTIRWFVFRLRRPAVAAAEPPPADVPKRPSYALPVTIAFVAIMLSMNSTIYEAFDRIPVGIAITLEFLGPLAVAIVGSVRRGRRLARGGRGRALAGDLVLIAFAAGGVALLGVHPAGLSGLGVLFALLAAACWAGYISLGGLVSRWYPSPYVLTAAWTFALVAFAIPALVPHGAGFLTWHMLRLALVVGLTSSAVPTMLEMFALGRVPPSLFAILESLAPAVAALAAWALVGERLSATDWVAIALVIVASAGATLNNARHRPVVPADS